jgi:hypothetical protein
MALPELKLAVNQDVSNKSSVNIAPTVFNGTGGAAPDLSAFWAANPSDNVSQTSQFFSSIPTVAWISLAAVGILGLVIFAVRK